LVNVSDVKQVTLNVMWTFFHVDTLQHRPIMFTTEPAAKEAAAQDTAKSVPSYLVMPVISECTGSTGFPSEVHGLSHDINLTRYLPGSTSGASGKIHQSHHREVDISGLAPPYSSTPHEATNNNPQLTPALHHMQSTPIDALLPGTASVSGVPVSHAPQNADPQLIYALHHMQSSPKPLSAQMTTTTCMSDSASQNFSTSCRLLFEQAQSTPASASGRFVDQRRWVSPSCHQLEKTIFQFNGVNLMGVN
jgi:hypothetical protein